MGKKEPTSSLRRRLLTAAIAGIAVCVMSAVFIAARSALIRHSASPSSDPASPIQPPPTPVSTNEVLEISYQALVIGINDYVDKGWSDLENARNDAEKIADILESRYRFSTDRLIDNEATESGILRRLTRILNSATETDAVLIYYAGHGLVDGMGAGYWIPADGGWQEPDGSLPIDGWIRNSTIRDLVDKSEAKHVLIIADTCFSGSLLRGGRDLSDSRRSYARKMRDSSRFVITSGDLEPVRDSGEDGHSTFAYAIIRQLEHPPTNIFTAAKLGAEISPFVPDQKVTSRTLKMSKYHPGEFVFLRDDAELPTNIEVIRPEIITEAPDKPAKAARDQAKNELARTVRDFIHWRCPDDFDFTQMTFLEADAALNNGQYDEAAAKFLQASEGFRSLTNTCLKTREILLPSGKNIELAWIPPGTFSMGGSAVDNTPRRVVMITRPFWIGTTEITQQQYYQVYKARYPMMPPFSGNDDFPQVGITWAQAKNFCDLLHEAPFRVSARLPTEAEWEYVAQLDDELDFAFRGGYSELFHYGNYCDRSCEDYTKRSEYGDDGLPGLAPVGYLDPTFTKAKLYDLHGNAQEWCEDWYRVGYADSANTDPEPPRFGSFRVVRGGSWRSTASECRSSFRQHQAPSSANDYTGFRIVIEADQPPDLVYRQEEE